MFRSLHKEFSDLAMQDIPAQSHPDQLLVWVSYAEGKGESGEFMLGGGLRGNFRVNFEDVATRAGVNLGAPRGSVPMNFWLHHLFLDLLQSDPDKYLYAPIEGVSGTIQSVCA